MLRCVLSDGVYIIICIFYATRVWFTYEKSLNSDGQQFHQYIYKTKNNFSHNTIKLKEEHDCIGNSGHGLGPLQQWGEIKPVNAISTLSI